MESRRYGRSDLRVSAIAYGAMSIKSDPAIREGVAPSLLAALESGINLIDTARAYGDSEALVASTLRQWRGERPLISTKVAPLSRETFRFHRPMSEAYTAQNIRTSIEKSLGALNVETLDIVHLHQWHYLWTHEAEWLDTLRSLRKEGKLRCIAVSAQDHEHDGLLEAVSRDLLDGVQIIFNLFESRPMNALLPLTQRRGVGVIARCVYDSGGLSDTLSRKAFAERLFLKFAPYTEYQARLAELREALVPQFATNIAELAVRFALSAPGVSSLTLGMPGVAMVKDAIEVAAKGALAAEAAEAIRRRHVWTKNFYEKIV
jgi:aryl-alcohol dehydrogenase-like predicted oxidoreductase